jgi:hypothetical protein
MEIILKHELVGLTYDDDMKTDEQIKQAGERGLGSCSG